MLIYNDLHLQIVVSRKRWFYESNLFIITRSTTESVKLLKRSEYENEFWELLILYSLTLWHILSQPFINDKCVFELFVFINKSAWILRFLFKFLFISIDFWFFCDNYQNSCSFFGFYTQKIFFLADLFLLFKYFKSNEKIFGYLLKLFKNPCFQWRY